MTDPTISGIISISVRIFIAIFIFWIYYKNKSKLALCFSAFFFSIGIASMIRTLGLSSQLSQFFYIFFLLFGVAMIFQGLQYLNVKIKRCCLVQIMILAAVIISYFYAYVPEYYNISVILATILGGFGLLTSAYYFNKSSLSKQGKNLLVAGLSLEGLFHFMIGPLMIYNQIDIVFSLSLIFIVMIACGWYACLNKKKH